MKRIPDEVVRRLPQYLRRLDDLHAQGQERVSSGQLCRQLHMAPSQLRQDLSWFGDFTQQAFTYDIDELRHEIGRILGTYDEYSAVLVGPGKIGSALLENFQFIVDGYTVLGAFDASPERIGTEIAGVKVHDIAGLGDFVRENKVDIAILTVPRGPAQEIADTLVANGIQAIWNFTNCDLDVGESDVLVENVHFSDSLLALNYYLSRKKARD